MLSLKTLCAFLFIALSASAAPVWPIKVSPGGHYLIDQAGNPVFLQGDSPWYIVTSLNQADADYYMSNRWVMGYNALLVDLVAQKVDTGKSYEGDIYGQLPFTNTITGPYTNLMGINTRYWTNVDWLIQRAQYWGITIVGYPLYDGFNGEGWYGQMFGNTSNTLYQYGQFIGARYKDQGNIIWAGAGDFNEPNSPNFLWNIVAAGISSIDSNHLITAQAARPNPATYFPFVTVNSTYGSAKPYVESLSAYNRSPVLASFAREPYYEHSSGPGHTATAFDCRNFAWWEVTCGESGQFYGNENQWPFNTGWQSEMWSTAARTVTNVGSFMQSKRWWTLIPDQTHAYVTSGYGTSGNTDYATAAADASSTIMLCYTPVNHGLVVNMAKFPNKVNAKWLDPTTGSLSSIAGSPFNNSGSHTFTPSATNAGGDTDWLLVIEVAPVTYHVSTTGNDSTGDGSAGNPWLTPWHALSQSFLPGDTLSLSPGSYPMYIHGITASSAGLPDQPITLIGTNAIIEGSGIYVANSNWVFKSLTFSNLIAGLTPHQSGGVVLGSRAHGFQMLSCTMRDFTNDAYTWGVLWINDAGVIGPNTNVRPQDCAANCVVSNCLFTNFFSAQAVRVGGSNNLIVNNTLVNHRSGDLFQFFGCSNVIRGNFCTNATEVSGGQHPDTLQTYGQDGNILSAADPFYDSYGNTIENNQFWDCKISFGQMTTDNVLLQDPSHPIVTVGYVMVRNNLYVRCGNDSGSQSSIGVPNSKFINNTYIFCATNVNASGEIFDLSFHNDFDWATTNNPVLQPDYRGQATNTTIANNAFIGCGRTTFGGWYSIESGFGIATNTWNLVAISNYVTHWTGSAWTTKYNQNQYNIKNDPNPTDPDIYVFPADINNGDDPKLVAIGVQSLKSNMRPVAGSPLIDKGTNIPWAPNDIEGMTRFLGLRQDIGCFEYDSNCVLHLDWDERPTASNYIADVTGYGGHAWQFDTTNFCKLTNSIDGSVASSGNVVGNAPLGYSNVWYAAITNIGAFQFITNGTFSCWVLKYDGNTTDPFHGNRWDAIFNGGEPIAAMIDASKGTNSFGIQYGFTDLRESTTTSFVFVVYGTNTANDLSHPSVQLGWPGPAADGVTWAHLAATWSGNGMLQLYYNGQPCASTPLGSPWLRVSASPTTPWAGINTQTHGGTPQWGDDNYPNYGMLKGSIDDLRLYNRVLSASEIQTLAGGVAATSPGGTTGTGNNAPVITSQPQAQSVYVGQNATFTVTATGDPTLHYQWTFNGSNVGTDSPSYTRSNCQLSDTGQSAQVTVSNGVGNQASSAATLTVSTAPSNNSGTVLGGGQIKFGPGTQIR